MAGWPSFPSGPSMTIDRVSVARELDSVRLCNVPMAQRLSVVLALLDASDELKEKAAALLETTRAAEGLTRRSGRREGQCRV